MEWNEFDPEKDLTPKEPETPAPEEKEPADRPSETMPEYTVPPEKEEEPAQPEPTPEEQPKPASENTWYSYPGDGNQPFYGVPLYQEPEYQRQNSKKGLRTFALVLAFVILFVSGICAGYWTGLRQQAGVSGQNTSAPAGNAAQSQTNSGSVGSISSFDIATGSKSGEAYAYEQIVAKVSPSIVNITIYSPSGQDGSYASGIIMDAQKGYVLTNDHIYSGIPNAKFLITLNDGTEFKASFVSGDSRSDIAILKIENPQNLTAAQFNTDPLAVGEAVLAIGQSYGYADTVSEGIVSAVDRRVSLSSGAYSERYIQTTAAINPGNSGGALVNMYGQVVGVTSAKIATEDVEGLGFAIPTERVLDIVTNLQQNGKVVGRAKLGITYTEIGTVLAEVNGTPTGLYIQEISEDSGLYGKGFTAGDIITSVNGQTITISSVVLDVIEESKAGDTVTLEIYKAKTQATETVSVVLAEAESTNSYSTSSADSSEETGNDLPENPYEYYYDYYGGNR